MEGNVGPKIKEKLEIEEDEASHCTPIFGVESEMSLAFHVVMPSQQYGMVEATQMII
jgi:hypothetical protein